MRRLDRVNGTASIPRPSRARLGARLGRVLLIVGAMPALVACRGTLLVTPQSGGMSLPATWRYGIGSLYVTITMPDGEVLQGNLAWVLPGAFGTTIFGAGGVGGTSTSFAGTNVGWYIGTLSGTKGTTMWVELMCNTWTGKGAGFGRASDGTVYLIQK